MVQDNKKIVDLRQRTPPHSRFLNPRPEFPERRRMPLREKRRRVRAAVFFLVVLAAAGAVAGISFLSYMPRFSVNDIVIEGANDVPARLVRAYVETVLYDGTSPLLSRTNVFLYPRAAVAGDVVKEFPRIREARVSRAGLLAQAVAVAVAERQPFALWCAGADDCYLMDDGGFIFAPASTTTAAAMPVFRGGLSVHPSQSGQATTTPIGETLLPVHLKGLLALFDRLRQAGFAPRGAVAENEQDFSVSFSEGFVMRASFGSDANVLVKNLQLTLSSDPLKGKMTELDYIDLRFGDRVYYKFKNGVSGSAAQ